jgi:hypothetical protein
MIAVLLLLRGVVIGLHGGRRSAEQRKTEGENPRRTMHGG